MAYIYILHFYVIEIIYTFTSYTFNLSLISGWGDDCVYFFVEAHYLFGRKLTNHLRNTPNSSPTAHISDTSRDTTSFASNT